VRRRERRDRVDRRARRDEARRHRRPARLVGELRDGEQLPAQLERRIDAPLRIETGVRSAPPDIQPTALVGYIASYWDLYWLLDDAQQRLLLRLRPSAFDDDVGNWGLSLAATHYVHGDAARARAYADSARAALEQQLKPAPEDAGRHALLGVALAYMGRKADAIREGQYGLALLPASKDAFAGAYDQHQLARIYILVGEPEKALDQLEPLLKIPYFLSPALLRIDPTFAPLRGNPRFERLIGAG